MMLKLIVDKFLIKLVCCRYLVVVGEFGLSEVFIYVGMCNLCLCVWCVISFVVINCVGFDVLV